MCFTSTDSFSVFISREHDIHQSTCSAASFSSPVYQHCGSKRCAPDSSDPQDPEDGNLILICPKLSELFSSSTVLLTFFSATLHFTGFAIADGVNQCDRSTRSCPGRTVYNDREEFCAQQKKSGAHQGQSNEMLKTGEGGRAKEPNQKKHWQYVCPTHDCAGCVRVFRFQRASLKSQEIVSNKSLKVTKEKSSHCLDKNTWFLGLSGSYSNHSPAN